MESGIRKQNHGILETETETEMEMETGYGKKERRFQVMDLKKNISNDNKINKQIKKRHK